MARPKTSEEELRAQLKNTRNMLYAERKERRRAEIVADTYTEQMEGCTCGKGKIAERMAREALEAHDAREAANAGGNAAKGEPAEGPAGDAGRAA